MDPCEQAKFFRDNIMENLSKRRHQRYTLRDNSEDLSVKMNNQEYRRNEINRKINEIDQEISEKRSQVEALKQEQSYTEDQSEKADKQYDIDNLVREIEALQNERERTVVGLRNHEDEMRSTREEKREVEDKLHTVSGEISQDESDFQAAESKVNEVCK